MGRLTTTGAGDVSSDTDTVCGSSIGRTRVNWHEQSIGQAIPIASAKALRDLRSMRR